MIKIKKEIEDNNPYTDVKEIVAVLNNGDAVIYKSKDEDYPYCLAMRNKIGVLKTTSQISNKEDFILIHYLCTKNNANKFDSAIHKLLDITYD